MLTTPQQHTHMKKNASVSTLDTPREQFCAYTRTCRQGVAEFAAESAQVIKSFGLPQDRVSYLFFSRLLRKNMQASTCAEIEELRRCAV